MPIAPENMRARRADVTESDSTRLRGLRPEAVAAVRQFIILLCVILLVVVRFHAEAQRSQREVKELSKAPTPPSFGRIGNLCR